MSAESVPSLVEFSLQIMIFHASIALRQQPNIVLRVAHEFAFSSISTRDRRDT
jgi:hypothetical protein